MWHRIEGCPIGELPPGASEEYIVSVDGRVTVGTYCESLFGTWRWVDPRGRKIQPEWFAEIKPPPGS